MNLAKPSVSQKCESRETTRIRGTYTVWKTRAVHDTYDVCETRWFRTPIIYIRHLHLILLLCICFSFYNFYIFSLILCYNLFIRFMHLNYDKGITEYLNVGEQFCPFITQFNIESGICFSKVWRIFATYSKHNEGYASYPCLNSQNIKLNKFKILYYFIKLKTLF